MANSNVGLKIWSMATVLRDFGVSKSDYLEQITYLLFLKMADEYSKPPHNRDIGIPADCRWEELKNKSGKELFEKYEYILKALAEQTGTLQHIYTGARNNVPDPAHLAKVIEMVDSENWSSMSSDIKGDIYEDLLEKIAADTKSGAGQYFTPRALINAMVRCVKPQKGKTIADPCCGSGGFLLATKSYIENQYGSTLNRDEKDFLKFKTFFGWELVSSTYKLCLMNLFLHNISDFQGRSPVICADSLIADPGDRFDYILTNPPFGIKSSRTFTNEQGEQEQEGLVYKRQDFWVTSRNKQLNFIQHIRTLLKTNGVAAVVVPDNVLFEEGAGETVRVKLLQTTDLHTILRLPTGIFYKPGVKANVIFFDNRPGSPQHQTKEVWIYDYRTNIHHTLKKNPLKSEDLDDFVKCYNPDDRSNRTETFSAENPDGRWRRFTYDEIMTLHNKKLNIRWIRGEETDENSTLKELLEIIEDKSNAIANAVEKLKTLIGEVDE